jgi:hypothetical protein
MATFFDTGINDSFLSLTVGANYVIRSQNDLSNQQHIAFSNASASLLENAAEICRKGIGEYYLEKTTWNGLGTSNKFDIAILFNRDDHQYNRPLAFIVVELGECRRYPEVWTVNLICGTKDVPGVGGIMMGLYLFTIFHNTSIHGDNKFGLLELANAYLNVGGLASYSKLGYIIDEGLYTTSNIVRRKTVINSCFGDRSNLPMRTPILTKDHIDRIIVILNNRDRGFTKPPICNIIGDRTRLDDQLFKGVLQLFLGLCKNLILLFKYKKYILEQELADSSKINLPWFKTFILPYVANPALSEHERIQQGIVTPLETYFTEGSGVDINTLDLNTIPGFRDFFMNDNFKHAINGPIIQGIEEIQKKILEADAPTQASKQKNVFAPKTIEEFEAQEKQKEKTKELVTLALRRSTRSTIHIPVNPRRKTKLSRGGKKTHGKKRNNKKTRKYRK